MSNHSQSLDSIITKHFKNKADEYLKVIELFRENDIEICLLNLPVNIRYESNPSDLDIVLDKLNFNKCIGKLVENNFTKTRLFVDTCQIVLSKKSKDGTYLVNVHIHQNLSFFTV